MDAPDSTGGVQAVVLRETLRRRWRAVLLGVLLGGLLAAAALLVAPPQYVSTASVLVTATEGADAATPINGQGNKDTVNLDTEAQLVTSTDTVERARTLLGGTATAQDLEDRVSATIPANTSVLQISFSAPSAAEAQRGAQAFAQAYLTVRGQVAQDSVDAQTKSVQEQVEDVRKQLQTASGKVQAAAAGSVDRSIAQAEADVLTSQLSALTEQLNQLQSVSVSPGRVIVTADLPSGPAGAGPLLIIAGGLVLGLVVGAGLALARDRADKHLRTAADVARLVGVPVVSLLEDKQPETSGSPSRGFRRLSNTLSSLLPNGRRAVVVAGAGVETPSAVVAVQLAVALATSGHTVTLVSTDPGTDLPVDAEPAEDGAGLGEVLSGRRALADVVRPVPAVPGLQVLHAGADTTGVSAQLQGRPAAVVVDALCDLSEFVVLHTAPAGASTDAQSLARLAHAALVVVEAGRTEADDLTDAIVQLHQVHLDDVSCVLAGPKLLRPAARPATGRRPRRAEAPAREPQRGPRVRAESVSAAGAKR